MKKLLLILFGLICAGVAVTCIVMFVMAIQFGELGRVVFYFTIGMFAVSLGIWAIMRIRDMKKAPQ